MNAMNFQKRPRCKHATLQRDRLFAPIDRWHLAETGVVAIDERRTAPAGGGGR